MTTRAALALQALAYDRDMPLVILCADEGAAEALAATLAAVASDRPVVFLPSSDQLPGDPSPPSPANVGRRVAALGRLRTLSRDGADEGLILVASGEAAARRYMAPETFDERPPVLTLGERLDPAVFRVLAAGLGYFEDDIVDEAGEVCLRGAIIDIFPADAGQPVRIELDEGRIAALHCFDPFTQLTSAALEAISIGRASEPTGAQPATLLDHIRPGRLVFAPKADRRRKHFVALAGEAAKASSARDSIEAIDEGRWHEALRVLDLIAGKRG